MEQSEKHFNTLLFCGFEKSTKSKVHRGLRGSSPLEQIKMLQRFYFLSGAISFPQERKGLGTPATRAGIIENLIFKGFVERDKKNLIATHKGISLVTIVADSFKSAETTAKWEMELTEIAQGKTLKEEFLKDIEKKIREVVLTYSK